MIGINKQIRDIGIDIIVITTAWALINSPYIATNHYLYLMRRPSPPGEDIKLQWYNNPNNLPIYTTILGLGLSTYMAVRSLTISLPLR